MTELSGEIEKRLPSALVRLIRGAGELAAERGETAYLAGGAVRDLLLGRRSLDLDVVIDGDALRLARRLAADTRAKVVAHARFGTASILGKRWRVDFATLRSETYERPGALPAVGPGTLETDLFRRDFTINAMAIQLSPDQFGQLIDRYGGQHDLEQKLLRVLHERSFIDDATRIWRAVRYEQRLGFTLEANTEAWLRRDLPMLDTISGDRIRHELERVLDEKQPEKVLMRADELGLLPRLHPGLKGDEWLARRFRQARRAYTPPRPLYVSIFFYRLSMDDAKRIGTQLHLDHDTLGLILRTLSLKQYAEPVLSRPGQPPSAVHYQLRGAETLAVVAYLICTGSAEARRNVELFLDRLQDVRPELNGDDLMDLGVPEGPRIKKVLDKLLAARLDGEIDSREEEIEMVERWVAGV